MRVVLVIAVLLAGCASTTPTDGASGRNETTPTDGPVIDPIATPSAPVSDRMPASAEPFILYPDHTINVIDRTQPPLVETTVAETVRATAFYESFATSLSLTQWPGPLSRSAWESTADIDITLRFKANAPAVGANPSTAGFPSVGAFFGTADRVAYLLFPSDAPQTLEAGTIYTVHLVAPAPKGGFFLREGESLAITPFLSYQVADGSAPMYVVGGSEPSGFTLQHEHFNLSAPRATVILDETGEIDPNPGISGDQQQKPIDIPFTVPADAVYITVELAGTPKAGPRVDMDVAVLTPGGDRIAGGISPLATETVVLGPGNLAAYGRDLVAHLTNSGNPGGATYALKITAYGP